MLATAYRGEGFGFLTRAMGGRDQTPLDGLSGRPARPRPARRADRRLPCSSTGWSGSGRAGRSSGTGSRRPRGGISRSRGSSCAGAQLAILTVPWIPGLEEADLTQTDPALLPAALRAQGDARALRSGSIAPTPRSCTSPGCSGSSAGSLRCSACCTRVSLIGTGLGVDAARSRSQLLVRRVPPHRRVDDGRALGARLLPLRRGAVARRALIARARGRARRPPSTRSRSGR